MNLTGVARGPVDNDGNQRLWELAWHASQEMRQLFARVFDAEDAPTPPAPDLSTREKKLWHRRRWRYTTRAFTDLVRTPPRTQVLTNYYARLVLYIFHDASLEGQQPVVELPEDVAEDDEAPLLCRTAQLMQINANLQSDVDLFCIQNAEQFPDLRSFVQMHQTVKRIVLTDARMGT